MGIRITVFPVGGYVAGGVEGGKFYGYCPIEEAKSAKWLWDNFSDRCVTSQRLEDFEKFLHLLNTHPEEIGFFMTAKEYREFIDLYCDDCKKLMGELAVELGNKNFKALYYTTSSKYVTWR
jgi:hypothetical protein